MAFLFTRKSDYNAVPGHDVLTGLASDNELAKAVETMRHLSLYMSFVSLYISVCVTFMYLELHGFRTVLMNQIIYIGFVFKLSFSFLTTELSSM